tara:strand:+ start:1073 stop:1990 length:918 start_codon:yes stop_codon:yes gene_type:complete
MKIILTENQFKRVILKEQGRDKSTESDDNILGKYDANTLDNCGYYAIEKFEEHYGNEQGGGMGDTYFEGNYKKFDELIKKRVNDLTPNVWNSLSSKDKMQLWSFMYNSDSRNVDKYRWLAVLDLTANENIIEFDESYTMNIINKKGSTQWNNAVQRVNSHSGWDSNKLKKMIDGQYETYNPDRYANTWSYRPTTLEEMYNECIGSTVNNEVEDNLTITFNDLGDARDQLLALPKDNYGSATIKGNTITITKDGDTITGISGIFDPSEDNLRYNRLTDLKNKYGYEAISDIVKVGSLWFVVLKLNN